MRLTAPTLQTERLILRHQRAEDLRAWTTFFATDATRFMDGPLTAKEAWLHFSADMAAWQLMGFGAWSVEHRGTYIGQVGLNHPPHYPEIEMGWMLFPEHQGQGFATEAAHAVRAFAYGELGLRTLVSYIDPGNAASIAVAERLGATRDDVAARVSPSDLVYRHPSQGAVA